MTNSFIAREWLHSLIDSSPNSNILISGQSGTGKSTFSSQLSHTHKKLTLLTHHCSRYTFDSIETLSAQLTHTLTHHFNLPKKSSIDTIIQNLRNRAPLQNPSQKPRIIFDAIDQWLYQKNAIKLLNFLKNLLIPHLSAHIQFILTSRSNNLEPLHIPSDFFHINLDFNDAEPTPNPLNINLINEAIELTLTHLRTQKYLSDNFASLMRCTTEIRYRNLVNTIVIKSNCNLLFITTLFNFVRHQKIDLHATVDALPSTLNGLYLYMTQYLYDSYKIVVDTNCVASIPPSESMSSWTFHKSFQSEENIDLFHLILGVAVCSGAAPMNREEIFEKLQARFGDTVNEYLFELTFNLMDGLIFDSVHRRMFHLSFGEFLVDVKFCTSRHCVDLAKINEIFVCFYWKRLLGISEVDDRYYVYLNGFKECLVKCGDREAVDDRLCEIYEIWKRDGNRSATQSTLNTISTTQSNRNPIRRFFRNAVLRCCCPYLRNSNSIDS